MDSAVLAVAQLATSSDLLTAVLENTPNVAVQLYAADGTVLFWNRFSVVLYGHEASEVIGRKLGHGLLYEDDAAEWHATLREVVETQTRKPTREWELRTRDGELCVVDATTFPVTFGDGEVVVVCMDVDVTARRRAENALRRSNEELEERVRARTSELERIAAELETFSYSVSHDLRAPLRAIMGFAAALEEDAGATLDAESREHLTRIVRAGDQMAALMDGLLVLARVGRADLHPQTVSVTSLVDGLVDELRPTYPGRHVEVRVTPGIEVHGDARLLRTLLQNLLDNAFKFSAGRDPAHVTVTPWGGAPGAAGPGFVVADDGVGFDADDARVFEAFQRQHAGFPGSGIGLATVRRIVDRLGGSVRAESVRGSGARFFVTLPPAPVG